MERGAVKCGVFKERVIVQVIREAKSLLLGEYEKLFERDSFKTILLASRSDSEAVCRN